MARHSVLMTFSTTHRPATDLGFLLRKHPDRVHDVETGFGDARVFDPEASEERCTVALVLGFDSVGLVRDKHNRELFDYANDRRYAASASRR